MPNCLYCPHPNDSVCVGKSVKKVDVSIEKLNDEIIEVLRELYDNDKYLIEIKANEVCIAALFWHYFKNRFQDTTYKDYNIDIEYNRNGVDSKRYTVNKDEKTKKRLAKPDMIIHKRYCNDNNLLFIEFKGKWNNNRDNYQDDEEKLMFFTAPHDSEHKYAYKYGVQIIMDENIIKLNWYKKGENLHCCQVNSTTWVITEYEV